MYKQGANIKGIVTCHNSCTKYKAQHEMARHMATVALRIKTAQQEMARHMATVALRIKSAQQEMTRHMATVAQRTGGIEQLCGGCRRHDGGVGHTARKEIGTRTTDELLGRCPKHVDEDCSVKLHKNRKVNLCTRSGATRNSVTWRDSTYNECATEMASHGVVLRIQKARHEHEMASHGYSCTTYRNW
jgi:hypothetical protein